MEIWIGCWVCVRGYGAAETDGLDIVVCGCPYKGFIHRGCLRVSCKDGPCVMSGFNTAYPCRCVSVSLCISRWHASRADVTSDLGATSADDLIGRRPHVSMY